MKWRALPQNVLIAVAVISLPLLSAASPVSAEKYPIIVTNNCSSPLYIRGFAGDTLLEPDNHLLSGGETKRYLVDLPWSGGRVYACWKDTSKTVITNADKMMLSCVLVEQTIKNDGDKAGNLFSNISFVDAISMPVRLQSPNGSYCSNSGAVTAHFNPDDVIKGCPTALVGPVGGPKRVCLGAFKYCDQYCKSNPSPRCRSFCSKLDDVIAACQAGKNGKYPGCAAGGLNTTDVYGCRTNTFFASAEGEKYCMAINRGILPSFDNQTHPKKYYPGYPRKDGAFNTYGAFVHHLTGNGIFAISYDDYPSGLNQGGYVNCQSSTEFKIEYCPGRHEVSHSCLGNSVDRHHAGLLTADTDIYAFSGVAGEKVTVRIGAPDAEPGKQAGLGLSGNDVSLKTEGEPPLELETTLPRTGAYEIAVTNMIFPEGERFIGNYSVKLSSSEDAWKSLRSRHSVEKQKP